MVCFIQWIHSFLKKKSHCLQRDLIMVMISMIPVTRSGSLGGLFHQAHQVSISLTL